MSAMPTIPDEIRPQLREYIALILGPVQAELRESRAAIQELAGGLISQERMDTLKFQVANQSEQLVTLERRLNRLERLIWLQLLTGWSVLIAMVTFIVARYLIEF